MPAFSVSTLNRVLQAVQALQCDGQYSASLSAIRRMDGELRQACPMGDKTARRAVLALLATHALMLVPGELRDTVRLPAQARKSWTNRKRREAEASTAA